jgi:hypothetical protein
MVELHCKGCGAPMEGLVQKIEPGDATCCLYCGDIYVIEQMGYLGGSGEVAYVGMRPPTDDEYYRMMKLIPEDVAFAASLKSMWMLR